MKYLLLCLAAIACPFMVVAQSSGGLELISSAGGDFNASAFSVSWSLGEPVTTTLSNNDVLLTQGFHQPSNLLTSVYHFGRTSLDVKAYPNPTQRSVIIETKASTAIDLQYQLLTILGKEVQSGSLLKQRQELSLQALPAQLYVLRLIRPSGQAVSVIKIQKID